MLHWVDRLVLCALVMTVPAAAATCESLAGLKLPGTTITAAHTVAAGAFAPSPDSPAQPALAANYKALPAFCRVQGVIQPSNDSHIEFEAWMPSSGWNGKYQGLGNGGFAGSIGYSGLAAAVNSGYAGSSTDTGHKAISTDAEWALGHPEKVADFDYRAIHETAEKAKEIVRTFYGNTLKRSYFSGCSNGGRQALMEAQRYPADYDGIIAGAPANFITHHLAGFIWDAQATEADPASYIPASKMPAIEAASVAACDALDGVKDGVIDDPTKCHFDPAPLLCKDSDSASCLTQPQLTALKKIYAGPSNSKDGQIFPGYLPGGETGPGGWSAWITGPAPARGLQFLFAKGFFADMVYQDAAWDYRTFNFGRDVSVTDDRRARSANAMDPNLKPFKDRGGKLILYHGWSDAAIAPLNAVNYYQSVVSKMGPKDSADFLRLYMAPGMQHCLGGPGPNEFGATPGAETDPRRSMSMALERWVESGAPPDQIIATKYKSDGNPASGVLRTRPLCPYPQVARYTGSGSTDDASNFTCVAPK